MSKNTNGNLAAFALDAEGGFFKGLTKREYFAGLAMQGLSESEVYRSASASLIAMHAVDQADKLLEALQND